MNAKQAKAIRRAVRVASQIDSIRPHTKPVYTAAKRYVWKDKDGSDQQHITVQCRLDKLCPRAIYQRTKGVLRNASAAVD